MFSIKTTVEGTLNNELNVKAEISTKVEEDTFKDDLGRFLYSIECMGYPFKTSEIYDKCMESFNDSVPNNRYVTLFRDEIMWVQIKRS